MNVGQVAARGRTILEEAIATSGSRVTISRDSDDLDSTVDFDTLAVTDPTPAAPVASNVAALVVTEGATNTEVGTDRTAQQPAFRVFLPITAVNVTEGDVLTVTASRDARLTGARLLVTEVLDDALGIARQLRARRA